MLDEGPAIVLTCVDNPGVMLDCVDNPRVMLDDWKPVVEPETLGNETHGKTELK